MSIEINELFCRCLQALDEIQPKYPIYIFMSHCRSREHTKTDIIFSFSVNFATSALALAQSIYISITDKVDLLSLWCIAQIICTHSSHKPFSNDSGLDIKACMVHASALL